MTRTRSLLISLLALMLILIGGAIIAYRTIPTSNTSRNQFDTLIVLGTPANPDGSPSPEERERTLEGVREFKAGIAPHIIFTGGAAHNQFVEADVMESLAMREGVPASAIVAEDEARNTIQNIYYSECIMEEHHWNSAEIISSPSHLARTALILRHYSFAWSTHAAHWPPEYSGWQRAVHFIVEAEYCLRLRLLGFPMTRFLPQR